MKKHLTAVTASLFAISICCPAAAQEARDTQQPAGVPQPPTVDVRPDPVSPSQQPREFDRADYLLGDLGGLRTDLDGAGVDVSLGAVGELAWNPEGGARERVEFANQISFAARFNMGRLVGLEGGTFTVNISNREGRSLSRTAELGTLQQVQEIFGRGNITRISELSYAQDLFDGRLNIKLGRLDIGDDFVSFSCKFQNLTFCYFTPDHIAGDNFFAYPVSQWAARARMKLTDELAFKVGVYDINPTLASSTEGFSFNTSNSIGSNTMVELAWTPALGAQRLPGIYKAGFWYDSARRNDVFFDVTNQPLQVTGAAPRRPKGSYGFWAQAQQQLTGPHGRSPSGLTLFANFVQADKQVVRVDQVVNAGLFYTGAFQARPLDEIGFAVGRSHVSELVRQGQILRNATPGLTDVPLLGSEYPIELYYSVNFGKAVSIRPNVQYVINPGGTSANRDVLVVGLKSVLVF